MQIHRQFEGILMTVTKDIIYEISLGSYVGLSQVRQIIFGKLIVLIYFHIHKWGIIIVSTICDIVAKPLK